MPYVDQAEVIEYAFGSGGIVDKFGVVGRKSDSEFGTDFACATTSEL